MPPAGASTNPIITPELQEAISGRSQSGGLSVPQSAQTAVGAPPVVQGGTGSPASIPTSPTPSSSESEIITKALIQRQKFLSRIQEQGGSQSLQSMPVGF